MAVPELKRMGAKISIKKNKAFVIGQKKLNAADCISSDLRTTFSIILGAILGPLFYFISPDWCVLIGGFVAGTIAFVIGEKNVS